MKIDLRNCTFREVLEVPRIRIPEVLRSHGSLVLEEQIERITVIFPARGAHATLHRDWLCNCSAKYNLTEYAIALQKVVGGPRWVSRPTGFQRLRGNYLEDHVLSRNKCNAISPPSYRGEGHYDGTRYSSLSSAILFTGSNLI